MSGGQWTIPGFPHRGWTCIRVVDLNPDDLPPGKSPDYEACQVCGQYPIRFVHTIVHDDWLDEVDVGCVCVERLTQDYVNPRREEKRLKNRANARARWLKRRWRMSIKGSFWIKEKGHHIVVFRSTFAEGWKCCFDGKFGMLEHPTKEAAMLSVFNKLVHEESRR